ncbi:MAG: D-alanyl-D-alanine carboxypeptidase/D-alanyl-D-alanine-endopeptidase [Dysgonamonadaceae bacterium]|jgi:D-alanyl-D-alanine carboxypeptidase/D-alanyl-D-alanine-endopeptidase (penicillin-binding protein 4)|nr:D-alanyl-D-alanine carboxypeptidase/D-alanyl-D-alanine-endopeptidase [Dysgonamonadaceae bacterium]
MKQKKYYLFVYCFVFSGIISLFAQTHPALTNFIQKENLRHAGIGFKAIDLTTGKTVAACNENMALIPASNIKIITTATALELLGEDFHFETPVFYDGAIRDSVLEGNLYIQGSGDPTLGSEFTDENKEFFLQKWCNDIWKAGIRNILGNVIVLDQLFGYEGISRKWLWEDLGSYYAPGIYGISIFDNYYKVYLRSYSPGEATSVLNTKPKMENITFINNITANAENMDKSLVSGIPFSGERYLHGTIPANMSSFAVKGDIPDPGLYLANSFAAHLQKKGIRIKGKATTFRLNPQMPETYSNILTSVQSPSLSKIIQVVNVKSNNHYAEHLFKLLTVAKEINISAYWHGKGLDTLALFMHDGSGTSPLNAVSAGFLTDILVYMDKKKGVNGAFFKSLAIAGKEGTVASFLKTTPLAGMAHIKSGSITGVQAYSGYIENGNKRYAFSLIVNHFSGKRAALRKDMEQLLVEIFSKMD